MSNNHVSLKHSAEIWEFFIVLEKCATEKILNPAHLPLEFSIIL